MPALSTFTDYVASTGPVYLTGADKILFEWEKHSYLLRRHLRASDNAFKLQGGSRIQDVLSLDEDITAANYSPNDTFTSRNPQVLSTLALDWRFTADHMAWADQEVDLQISSGMTQEARFLVYKKMKEKLERRMLLSSMNFWENRLFAVPNFATMETQATGLDQYSILAFVNEYTNGLFAVPDAGVGLPGGNWTTVETINPATKPLWVNQREFYTSALTAAANTTAERNIIQCFDRMWFKVRFESPPNYDEYFENPDLNAQYIATSRAGMTTFIDLMRKSQDLYVTTSRQDPAYARPQYAGIELVYVDTLDTVKAYLDADTTPDSLKAEQETGADNLGPRYYWLNGKYLAPVFHTEHYMKKKAPMSHPNQPFTTVVWCDTYWNLVCRSRQRLGVVAPTGSIYP